MKAQGRPRVLGVCGTTTVDSRTRNVLDLALAAAEASGAEIRVIDLAEHRLPVMIERDADQGLLPSVQLVRESAAWAQGFVLASPEYHGSMSGALKNWFDFLWRELQGKVAGVVAVTSSGHAEKAAYAIKTSFQWCRGWSLPFHAAAVAADFEGARLVDPRALDRIQRVGHDVARYCPVLTRAFDDARALGAEPDAGFAGLG